MMRRVALAFAVFALKAAPVCAKPLEQVVYLLPAPENAIVFAPFLLAAHDGRYAQAGLKVVFRQIAGGANVGKALARGDGDLGGAIGDTPIGLRAQGVNVKGVALLGHHSFVTLMTRKDRRFTPGYSGSMAVPSLQDTTNYALQAWLESRRISPGKVSIQALPVDAITAGIAAGRFDAMVGTVDWGIKAERQGVKLEYRELEDVYPAMAQAIMASDATIAARPAMIRAFVTATLSEIAEIEHDPAAAADAWRALVPQSGYSRAETVRIFTLLRDHIYGPVKGLGRFDRGTMRRAVRVANAKGTIVARTVAENSYTNRFVGPAKGKFGN